MKKSEKAFATKFRLPEFEINQVGNWIISLRPQQTTLGSLIISLNRRCEKFSEITDKEGKELASTFKEVERILDLAFEPDKINYLALMMVDNQVHFHVIPRYSSLRIFEEQKFIDADWPKPPLLNTLDITDILLSKIINTLRQY